MTRRAALSHFATGLGIGIIMGGAAYFIPGPDIKLLSANDKARTPNR